MRTALSFFLAPLLAAQQAAAPKPIAGKDLPAVPGPFVERYCSTPGYHDPAADPSNPPVQMEIRTSARRGPSIPARALPAGPVAVSDIVGSAAGWKAYRVEVPAGARVHARIHSAHDGWFLVRTVNRMGALEEGMLQNLIGTGNPEATYTNPRKETHTIFFVVDTSELGAESEPYTLQVDWPGKGKS